MRKLAAVLIAALALLIAGCGGNASAPLPHQAEQKLVHKGEFQMVELENGQNYFGTLRVQPKAGVYVLTHVFYFGRNNANLVKLGKETHGPEDAMQIPFDRVLFWENLNKAGGVSRAIFAYFQGDTSGKISPS
jgi:hypothetical protein